MSKSPASTIHVIVGAGAVGSGTARALVALGHDVRIVTRSGSGPEHPRIERVAADATDADRLAELTNGAHALYNCANPSYSKWATDWPPLHSAMLHAAEVTGARLVIMSNLYGYAAGSSPMRATDTLAAPSRKGAIRTEMWRSAKEAHDAGRLRAVEVRASDFFGPGIGDSAHLGDRVVPRVLAGKSASMVGAIDQPHSWTYIDDVCATLATVGTDDRSLGRAWHVPTCDPMTAAEMVDAIADAAGTGPVATKRLPRFALRLAGVFVADIREMREMMYQFEAPFVIDAADTTATFGLHPTPLSEQLSGTIAAYRSDASASTSSTGSGSPASLSSAPAS